MTKPDRIKAMRARLAEINRANDRFRTTLAQTNDPAHQAFFSDLLDRISLIVNNEKLGATTELGGDLTKARQDLRRTILPELDPSFEESTPALSALRGARGNLVEALENAIDVARSLGLEPRFADLPEMPLPRAAFEAALVQLDERLRAVVDNIEDLSMAAAAADKAGARQTSNRSIVNLQIANLRTQINAARFETRLRNENIAPKEINVVSLARTAEAIKDFGRDVTLTLNSLRDWVAPTVRAAGMLVAKSAARAADGIRIFTRIVGRRLRSVATKENTQHIAGVMEGISTERELELQAATAAKFATLGEMAAGLAHELNQPIAIMSLAAENAVEALEAGEDGVEEALSRLRRILAQGDRAKAIVTQIRTFSRVDIAALEPIDLGACVHGMMILAGQALRDAGIRVALRLDDSIPPVTGQITLVEQVLLNIVLNARDALLESPPERRHLRIEATIGPVADEVTLRVLDTGPGLTPEIIEKMFAPFYSTKPSGLGTGLGLSISRTIMRGIGGRITAENAPCGGGTGASISLYFKRAG